VLLQDPSLQPLSVEPLSFWWVTCQEIEATRRKNLVEENLFEFLDGVRRPRAHIRHGVQEERWIPMHEDHLEFVPDRQATFKIRFWIGHLGRI